MFSLEPSVLRAALDYAGRGVPVFPAVRKGGELLALSPQGPFDATCSASLVERVFVGESLVAMPTGFVSGIVALRAACGAWRDETARVFSGGFEYFLYASALPFPDETPSEGNFAIIGTGGFVPLPPCAAGMDADILPLPERFRPLSRRFDLMALRLRAMERSAWPFGDGFF